jgi:hypothetical protein
MMKSRIGKVRLDAGERKDEKQFTDWPHTADSWAKALDVLGGAIIKLKRLLRRLPCLQHSDEFFHFVQHYAFGSVLG